MGMRENFDDRVGAVTVYRGFYSRTEHNIFLWPTSSFTRSGCLHGEFKCLFTHDSGEIIWGKVEKKNYIA